MAKIDTIEEITVEVEDGKKETYMLRIQSIDRNRLLMATVGYNNVTETVSQNFPVKQKDSEQTLRALAEAKFFQIYSRTKQ